MAISKSPKIPKKSNFKPLNFFDALAAVVNGKKITKLEWQNKEIYGFMNGEILSLHKDKINHQWIVSLGDLVGTDWIIL